MMATILNTVHLDFCHLAFSHCCTKLWLKLVQSDSNSFVLTQLDDGSHLELCHLGFSHCHLVKKKTCYLHLRSDSKKTDGTPFLNSDSSLVSDTDSLGWWQTTLNIFHLRFTQKHSHSFMTLTQTNSIWLKLIHSHLTWWWQPSWILAILDSAILVFHSQNFTCSLWLKIDVGSQHWHKNISLIGFCLIVDACTQIHWKTAHVLHSAICVQKKLPSHSPNDGNQLDDGSHHEFCHLGFSHFVQKADSN